MNATPTTLTLAYNNQPFVFREDGYINMTKAAKAFGKQLNNFWKSPETREYVEVLSEVSNIQIEGLTNVYRGGRTPGTWCHPKLAVFFARWLDVRFAVWCDLMIDNILKGKLEVSVKEETEETLHLVSNLERVQAGYNALQAQFTELEGQHAQLIEENQKLKEFGVQSETPPEGWKTERTFLEDTGMNRRLIQKIRGELGSRALSWCYRNNVAVFSRQASRGQEAWAVAYYPPAALEHAYKELLGDVAQVA